MSSTRAAAAGRRFVTLGDGRQVTLGAYVKAWRLVLSVPPETSFDRSLTWGRWTGGSTAAEILREFREGLDDRINRRLGGHVLAPRTRKGRRWDPDYQWALWRDARAANGRTFIRAFETDIARARLQHRLSTD